MKKFSKCLVLIFTVLLLTATVASAKKAKQVEDVIIQDDATIEQPVEQPNANVQNTVKTEEVHTSTTTEVNNLEQRAQGDVQPVNTGSVVSNISDIPNDYWAVMEINAVINEGIMTLSDDGKFNPDTVVKRVDFAAWVLNALENSTFQITVKNNYSDVNESTPGYDVILRNDQLGLIYGYPDGTFKPNKVISKAETNSIMSHITKDVPMGESILGGFSDVNDIPQWALNTYEKTVKYGLFVNYPDADKFLPNKDLNRAEAAVLLYRLRNALNLVKKAYKAEKMLATEHLSVTPLAPANTVQITDKRIIVDQGNVIKVAFANRFNSKNFNVGDEVYFYAKDDIKTDEGTLVFPKATKFLANIETLDNPQWLNKNAKMTIAFKNATFPDGKVVEFSANAFENEGVLVSNKWEKPLFWTLGGTVVGTGIGLAAGIPSDNLGLGLGIGIPTGAVTGAAIGFLTPGVNFGAAEGDEIYILIRDAFSIYTCTPEDN